MKEKLLSELLYNVRIKERINYSDKKINNITHNSRKIKDSGLFVAVRGFETDGHKYLGQAVENGAVAAIVEEFDHQIRIPQILVNNSRSVLARVSVNLYREELEQMRLIGITGTNGKTTTAMLLHSVMESAGINSGLIGTIHYLVGDNCVKAWNTTPESSDLCHMFYEMYQHGQRGCVIEVSSHALTLNRVDQLQFDTAVFTNLTQDHLDFHQDMELYFKAKQKLFGHLRSGAAAVVNTGDPYGKRIPEIISSRVISFSCTDEADIYPLYWQSTIKGLEIEFSTICGKVHINSSLIGEFNVENISAAVAAGIALEFNLNEIKSGIENVPAIPGRLETIITDNGPFAVVDYSHTPDALKKALAVLRKLTEGKIWVVFGCGGDRDRTKRPLMGKIAREMADHVIVTSDNPRTEDPGQIISEIITGINDLSQVVIEPDRKKAIEHAVKNARIGDSILIAGKGHEDYQEINGIKHPFDDRKIARDLLL